MPEDSESLKIKEEKKDEKFSGFVVCFNFSCHNFCRRKTEGKRGGQACQSAHGRDYRHAGGAGAHSRLRRYPGQADAGNEPRVHHQRSAAQAAWD